MKIFDLLIVEDDDGDVELMRETLPTNEGFSYRRAVDGEQAMALVADAIPDLIFLDLNIPKIDGRQFLETIKKDLRYNKIPVIVISTSLDLEDVKLSYELGANAYLAKSSDFEDFSAKMNSLGDFWLKHVVLPTFE